MYVAFRQHKDLTPADIDRLISRATEVERLMREIPGFVEFRLVRMTNGISSIALFDDRVGAEVANYSLSAWFNARLPNLPAKAAVVISGEQVMHFSG
jgi:hypothetical protein